MSFKKTSIKPSIGTVLVCLFNYAAYAQAQTEIQTEKSQPQINDIQEVVVTSNKQNTPLNQSAYSIQNVLPKTLSSKKPFFFGEVLNQNSGVYMPNLKNEQHSMSIRQPLNYNAVYSYLEDGIPIRPVGIFNHNALYEINGEGVTRIEVQKGPSSSLYGSNAVGGVVNFISKPIQNNDLTLGAQYDFNNYTRLHASKSFDGDTNDVRIDAYAGFNKNTQATYDKATKYSFSAKHVAKLNATTSITNSYTHNYLNTTMPGNINQTQYDTNDLDASKDTFTYRKVNSARWLTDINGQWIANGDSHIRLFARANSTNQLPSYSIVNRSPSSITGKTNFQNFYSWGMDAYHIQDIGNLKWLIGSTLDVTPSLNSHEDGLNIQKDTAGKNKHYQFTQVLRDYQTEIQNKALYTQLEYNILPSLKLSTGLRYDDIQYAYENNLKPSASSGAPSEKRHFSRLTPKIGLNWRASSNLAIFANFSQGFVPPEVNSLYGSRLVTPDLQPAIFNNIDVGMRFNLPYSIKGDISLYQLKGKNEQLNYTPVIGASIPINAGETNHRGIEWNLNYAPPVSSTVLSRVFGRWGGSYAQHQYKKYQLSPSIDFSGKNMPQAPKLIMNAELGYKINDNLSTSLEWQHLGDYFMNNANTIQYKGHDLLHYQLNYHIPATQYKAFMKVRNVFNQKYAEVASSNYGDTVASLNTAYNADKYNTYATGAKRSIVLGIEGKF
jgi:iron complex outermembrane recepter protein